MKSSDCFVLRNIFGQNLLMPVKVNEAGNEPILLNDIGAEIWKCALQGMSLDQTLQLFEEEYGIEKDSIEEKSIVVFIEEMCSRKLLNI